MKKKANPRDIAGNADEEEGEPQRYSWGMQKKVNRRDIAGNTEEGEPQRHSWERR